jgi:flagellar biosynthesis/type III secretory pathway chaperone
MLGIRELIKKLDIEMRLYRELIALLHEETDAVIKRDYKDLYKVLGRKEYVLSALERAVRERIALVGETLGDEPLKDDKSTISALILSLHSSPERDELVEAREKLQSLMDSAREVNRVNTHIVQTSLDNVNKTLGFLGNLFVKDTYGPSGAAASMEVKGSRLSEGV